MKINNLLVFRLTMVTRYNIFYNNLNISKYLYYIMTDTAIVMDKTSRRRLQKDIEIIKEPLSTTVFITHDEQNMLRDML